MGSACESGKALHQLREAVSVDELEKVVRAGQLERGPGKASGGAEEGHLRTVVDGRHADELLDLRGTNRIRWCMTLALDDDMPAVGTHADQRTGLQPRPCGGSGDTRAPQACAQRQSRTAWE